VGDGLPPDVWVAIAAIVVCSAAAGIVGAVIAHRLLWGRK